MKESPLSKGLFLTGRTVLGVAHFAVQSLADGIVELEAEMTQHTGVWDDKGQYWAPEKVTKDNYRNARRTETSRLQSKSREQLQRTYDSVHKLVIVKTQ